MKYFLVGAFLFFAPLVQAYNPVTVEVNTPFEKIQIPMDEAGQRQSYLGTLESYPHLYEFEVTETIRLEVQARQKVEPDALPINLIILSVNPETERISEVIRLNAPIAERAEVESKTLGLTLYESEWLEIDLEPGTYRLEVSSPLNERAYELDFGRVDGDGGYFSTFGTIREVQRHFGYNWLHYFRSTFILYQLGILIMLGGFVYVWRVRKKPQSLTEA